LKTGVRPGSSKNQERGLLDAKAPLLHEKGILGIYQRGRESGFHRARADDLEEKGKEVSRQELVNWVQSDRNKKESVSKRTFLVEGIQFAYFETRRGPSQASLRRGSGRDMLIVKTYLGFEKGRLGQSLAH